MTAAQLSRKFGIALSGGAATGKSVVSALLRDLGYTVIDADTLARAAVTPASPALAEIVEAFGSTVLNHDGTLHRSRLRTLICNDSAQRKILEDIVHPRIRELLADKLRQEGLFAKPRLWCYEAALLVETGTYRQFKQLWVTHCSPATQLTRLCRRDNLSAPQAASLIAAQLPTSAKLAVADLCIDTAQPPAAIKLLLSQQLENLTTNDLCHTEDGQVHGNDDEADTTTDNNNRERLK